MFTHQSNKGSLALLFFGNAFEHYDQILFYLLIPFIAPLFYGNVSYIYSLAIASIPFGLLIKPLGVLCFSSLARNKGIQYLLVLSLFGMGTVTLAIALLPGYQLIGISAPIILSLLRGLICFFSTAESTAAPLYLFAITEPRRHPLMSSFYEVSTMVGVFIASLLISILAWNGCIEKYWRYVYFFGALTGFIGVLFRLITKEVTLTVKPMKFKFSKIRKQLPSVLVIAFVTGFCCINYKVSMVILNGYLPLIINVTKEQMIFLHTFLTLFDMLFLPFFGWIACKVDKGLLMKLCLVCILILVLPLYQNMLLYPCLKTIFVLRFVLIFFGVGFAAPYQSYIRDIASSNNRFFTISFGKTMGKLFISGPLMSLSYFVLGLTGSENFPAIYIFVSAFICFMVMVLYDLIEKYREKAINTLNPPKEGLLSH